MMHAKRKVIIFLLLYLGVALSLLVHAEAGFAQQQIFSETPSATESAVSTGNIDLTETATPTQSEVIISSQITRRILVKISANARLINVMSRMEPYGTVTESSELAKLDAFILDVPDNNFDERLVELCNISGVGYVEPDYPVQALDTIPNDPSFPAQYGLTAIRAPQGWDVSTGSPAVTIAILDSGVDMSHPEMVGKVVQGYDFVNNDNNPQDDYGHGTHVAGIAAARGNNGLGIAGVSWGAQIMPVKVLNSFGQGSFSNVAAGIIWATDHSAQIINMSLGGSNYSQILQDAVDYAARRNVLLVASSGNTNSNFILYPARLPQVIAVAATNANNQHASFSNYGAEIDIAAPGDNILSLWLGGGYSTFSGTSMATAYVSGLAAVLLGYDNNARTVRQHLEATALDISPPGWDMYTGAGLIQMDAAIRLALSPTPAADPEIPNQQGGPIQFFASLTPIWTQTNLSTITPVPVTQTFTVTPGPSALSLLHSDEATQSVPFTPQPKEGGQKLDFQSPYFYCGSALILIGVLILILLGRNRSGRRHFSWRR